MENRNAAFTASFLMVVAPLKPLFRRVIAARLVVSPLIVSGLLLLSGCSTMSSFWSADESAQEASAQQPRAAATGSIAVVWRNNVDQRLPASPPGFSLPSVVDSQQGELIVVGGQDRRVRIYSTSGSEVGRIALQAAGESGALKLSNGLVALGDVTGTLYGLDINQAKVIWRKSLSAALIGSPVAVDQDFIIQTSNNQVYRFNADGEKIWSYSGSGLGGLSMHLYPSPVLHQNRVYVVFSNGDVTALKADNGSFLWKRQLLLSNRASVLSELKVPVATPLIVPADQSGHHEDVMMVSVFQGELTFLALRDGSRLSNRKLSIKSAPLLLGKQIIVADAAGFVSALNASGETLWKQQVSNGELTGPVLWRGSLWVADDHGRVFRLSEHGRVQASTRLDGRIDRSPVVAKNGVLVRNNLGTLYLLR